MKNRNIVLSVAFAILLIGTILFLYLNSADFITPPEILLPTNEDSEEIIYNNKYIIEEVDINASNILDVIESLERPLEYSCKLQKTIYAYDTEKVEFSDIFVSYDKIRIIDDDKSTLIIDELVYVTSNNITNTYNLSSFTSDEIIGMQTYENITNVSSATLVTENDVKYIKIITETDQKNLEYYIDLTNGLLVKYYETYEDAIIKEILLTNIISGEQNPDIFI